jgi:hypothetical protein
MAWQDTDGIARAAQTMGRFVPSIGRQQTPKAMRQHHPKEKQVSQ